ncbi:hypothetical protein ABVK25_009605 [Lepraria finkii]|uniref:Uncharacterized protein n=1 Tax=Lepraria finkii TaxID=1340010 RepID=A0ABR4AYU0_9LECA
MSTVTNKDLPKQTYRSHSPIAVKHDTETPPLDPFPHLPPYGPPTTGIVSCLPMILVPYAELVRLHKPYHFGTLFASVVLPPPPSQILWINVLFSIGSLFLRGAAYTWNDTLNAPYDRLVARCRHRPVARGAVSLVAAYLFTLAQPISGVAILYQLPTLCFLPAGLAFTMTLYPFAERVTNYPQVVLGSSLALGQLVGIAGMGMDPFQQTGRNIIGGMLCLNMANS